MLEPLFDHDCKDCVFLGTHEGMDLYVCPQRGMPTLIARHSSDGPDYTSGINLGAKRRIPYMAEAFDRAIARGLLVQDEKAMDGYRFIP